MSAAAQKDPRSPETAPHYLASFGRYCQPPRTDTRCCGRLASEGAAGQRFRERAGKEQAGEATSGANCGASIFENQSDSWFMVDHRASPVAN
jgi:hypothetical protein